MEDDFQSIIIRKSEIRSMETEYEELTDTMSDETRYAPSRYHIHADHIHFRKNDAVLGYGLPERVIFNPPATIVFWDDGTKTIVKTSSDDKFDRRTGFLTAFFQKSCGKTRHQANKFLESLEQQ